MSIELLIEINPIHRLLNVSPFYPSPPRLFPYGAAALAFLLISATLRAGNFEVRA